MRFTERDRRELIQKLKKIKDPRERDRILWALAGQEEHVFHSAPSPAPPSRLASHRPEPARPEPGKAPDLRNMPQINIDAKRTLGFVVPAFFVIFGLVRIGKAVLNYIAFQDIEAEMTGLITGGIFLIIGLAGIFRTMHLPPTKQGKTS
ncbi:MAG: hypothetical protein V1766_02885 [Pseudomonadota bacterium]